MDLRLEREKAIRRMNCPLPADELEPIMEQVYSAIMEEINKAPYLKSFQAEFLLPRSRLGNYDEASFKKIRESIAYTLNKKAYNFSLIGGTKLHQTFIINITL